MFCPSCGEEERQPSQFCRACGTDMRVVRTALQRPDAVTASAVTARDEIGRAIAAKIKELQTSRDLKRLAEDVLPEIEKFLESPQERRLRRMRAGVITASVGLGATLVMLIAPHRIIPFDPGWPAGLLVFLIGLGIVINGLLFSVPANQVPNRSQDARMQSMLDQLPQVPAVAQEEPPQAQYLAPPSSVTEGTTRQLQNEQIKPPSPRITH